MSQDTGRWLEGYVALVTGGASGIGRGIVDLFVRQGAQVAVLDLWRQGLAEVQAAHGGQVLPLPGDATRWEDNQRAVAETMAAFGRLDTLVCSVGRYDYYLSLPDIPAERLSEAFDEIFAVNVKSYLLSAKAALPHLQQWEGSIIFNVSSAGFYTGGSGFLYGATKWALRGLVSLLAYELAPRVRVNGVAPGGTTGTRLQGLRSLGQHLSADQVAGRDERIRASNPLHVLPRPEDHAWACLYLACRRLSGVVTGVIINTDGGLGSAPPGRPLS
jgi:NAD(P)-dependent dehydrogenase (short-subunit alcohol dehydrogenase family)